MLGQELGFDDVLPTAVLAPAQQLPATWSHPDLKRLRDEHRAAKADDLPSVARAEAIATALSDKVAHMQNACAAQRAKMEHLAQQLEAMQQALEAEDASTGKWRAVDKQWRDQIIYHKTIANQHAAATAAAAAGAADGSPSPASWSLGGAFPAETDGEGAGGVSSSSSANASTAPPLAAARVIGLSAQWPLVSLRAFFAAATDMNDAAEFLKRMAPSVRFEPKGDGALLFPQFYDEPCIVTFAASITAAGGLLPSGAAQPPATCGNPLCVYMHIDQAAHVVGCVVHLLRFLAPFRGKGAICAVGEYVDRVYSQLAANTSAPASSGGGSGGSSVGLSEQSVLILLHSVCSFLIASRLFKPFFTTPQSPAEQQPFMGKEASFGQQQPASTGYLSGGSASTAGHAAAAQHHQYHAWSVLRQQHALFPTYVESPQTELLLNWLKRHASDGSISATEKALLDVLTECIDLEAMEAAIIRDIRCTGQPTPLIWRLLLCTRQARGGSHAQIQWLAAKGLQLFPHCPAMHLWQVGAAVRDPATTEAQCVELLQRSVGAVEGQMAARAMSRAPLASLSSSSSSSSSSGGSAGTSIATSSLVALVLTKFRTSDALVAFLTDALRTASYACSVNMIFNMHLLVVAAHIAPYSSSPSSSSSSSPSSMGCYASSFLALSDVASPASLPYTVLSLQRGVGKLKTNEKAATALTRLGDFVLNRSKTFLSEHHLEHLNAALRTCAFRSDPSECTLMLQTSLDADVWSSHAPHWNEYVAALLLTEGSSAALEACTALEATGDMSLQLVAARHAAVLNPTAAARKNAILNAVASFRKAKGVDLSGRPLVATAGDPGAMLKLRSAVSVPQWVAFLTAYAGTCPSAMEGLAVLRAIPPQVLADPSGEPTVRWRWAMDVVALLIAVDSIGEFKTGLCQLLLPDDLAATTAASSTSLAAAYPVSLENATGLRQEHVTLCHFFALEVYRAVPLLEWRPLRIAQLRQAVLEVAVTTGCLHPLLLSCAPW